MSDQKLRPNSTCRIWAADFFSIKTATYDTSLTTQQSPALTTTPFCHHRNLNDHRAGEESGLALGIVWREAVLRVWCVAGTRRDRRGDMSIDSVAKIARLYHFTDRSNLPLIRELGGLYPIAELERMGIKVPAPGGNDWSREADARRGMGRYVHLCFLANHPMEYLARQDGRIKDSIFLQIHASVLQFEGVMFSPGVSNRTGVEPVPISQADALIDFQVLYTRTEWSDPAVYQRRQDAEKCEILVPQRIPLELIWNI